MSSSSIIIFGILSAILLIFSCITLNVANYYNELEVNTDLELVSTPTLVLRDRNFQTLKELN